MTRVFFDFTRSSVSFVRAGLPSRVRAKLIEKTEKPHVRIFLGLKDRDGLEGYR